MPNIEFKLDNLKRIEENVKNIGTGVYKAGVHVLGKLIDNWNEGKGLDGSSLQEPPISKRYGDYKEKKYGRRRIDMMATGKLQQSMHVTAPKATEDGIEVTVTASGGRATKSGKRINNVDILRGNVAIRDNIMKLDDETKEEVQKIIKDSITKK